MSATNDLHVIFGTGPAGLTLASELLARGKRVRLINRRGAAPAPAGAEVVAGDAAQLALVRELSEGATTIYNCTHAPYETWPEVLPRLQENFIEGAAAVGARLVVIDTLYLYGETHGQPMTEAMPHNATSRKGRLRAELAWGYLQADRIGKVRVAIGRAADFFGPLTLNSALGQFVFPAVLAGQPALTLGDIDRPHSYSYMSDIARGLATLGEAEGATGHDWLLPTLPAQTTRAILDALGEVLGGPVGIATVPTMAEARAHNVFDPTFAAEYDELFYQYTEPQIVDSSAFTSTFGQQPTPLDEALRATVAWYRAQQR